MTPPPPPRKSQNVKMCNFCNGFSKMMMSTFKKLQHLKFGGYSFIVKNIAFLQNMLPPQYCVTGPRWVKMRLYTLFAVNRSLESCSWLGHVITCPLFGFKLLREPVLIYCQHESSEQVFKQKTFFIQENATQDDRMSCIQSNWSMYLIFFLFFFFG